MTHIQTAEITAASQDLTSREDDLDLHMDAALNWLKRAQDKTDDDGIGYGYYLRGRPFSAHGPGWRPSYVETSGYIIETFYDAAKRTGDRDASTRAEKTGRWLLTCQNQDGSFSNTEVHGEDGLVFDTGQVLFGLTRCYAETSDPVFAKAATRAAKWLCAAMDADGAWRRHTHMGVVHVYNTRVAWAMLEYCKIIPDETVQAAAHRNLQWALTEQTAAGLFENCGFKTGIAPFTHTIAYAARGLFEGGLLLGDRNIIQAAYISALELARHVDETGFMPGRISADGNQIDASFCCLTGNCQMAILWFKMSRYFNDPYMFETGARALNYVLGVHNTKTRNKNIHGAVKGSHPIWGGYTPLAYPNWAAKFLIDAIAEQQMTQPSSLKGQA